MHITTIELENIKSHADAKFEFSRGTTAITGENGAGKTTLIEAVAWTLFDLLDYKKDDFVRRGAKKGIARVTFESGLDQREYMVYRDTGTGYYVYDPALKVRIAEKKEEVCRFLWQHLGVEPGTDLDSLFRRAIGVPQGTFTAIFLETPAERKKAFDKLLKVEEYRRGADELLKTTRFVEGQIAAAREKIARAEGELARFDAVEEEHRTVARSIEELTAAAARMDADAEARTAAVRELDEKETRLNAAAAARDAATAAHSKAELVLSHKQAGLESARRAAELIETVREASGRHVAAQARLKELERERGERDKLLRELSQIENAVSTVKSEQKATQERLERAQKAHQEIERLKPAVAEQERLEAAAADMRDRLARARAAQGHAASIAEKVERLRESYRSNRAEIDAAEVHAGAADGLAELELRDSAIVKEIAKLEAGLDRDERFQKEIKNGLCPILSQRCLNLKEGETLEAFVSSQFTELRTQIGRLREEQVQVTAALRTSREASKYSAQLATLKRREAEISEEGKRLKQEREALEAQIAGIAALEAETSAAEAALKDLGNPRAKTAVLEEDVRAELELRQAMSNIEANLERLESDRAITIEKLESYKDLDAMLREAAETRDATEDAHRTFLANEALAGETAAREKEFEAAKNELAGAAETLEAAVREFADADKLYDRERHRSEKAELAAVELRRAAVRTELDAAKRREAELKTEIERLGETRKILQAEFREKERLEKLAEATDFIRTTLKEAAPLVARNYVYHVSLEANQTFREITGTSERTLKWGEDYGIMLEEGGFDRPFSSLSGGEQMAAALSVRLALLKQLTDIRIAFFDEPTTNMDAERRENLAGQISRIGHFDQLFVISHDDTFEGYVDNVVSVERV